MHYSKSKEIAEIVRKLVKNGWCFRRGKKHGKLIAPNGGCVTVPTTPSDHRAMLNFRCDVRRFL